MIDHLVVNLKSVALLTRVKSLKEEGKQLCRTKDQKKLLPVQHQLFLIG